MTESDALGHAQWAVGWNGTVFVPLTMDFSRGLDYEVHRYATEGPIQGSEIIEVQGSLRVFIQVSLAVSSVWGLTKVDRFVVPTDSTIPKGRHVTWRTWLKFHEIY